MTDLQLDTLEARGLIRVATLQPELEYLFRHALLQDTAYESLLKQERRSLHQAVGVTLEQLYPERVAELAAILAMHFEQAGDTEKALTYLVDAARFAVERNALTEGFDLYSRASALLPPATPEDDDTLRRRRIDIELGRARAAFTFLTKEELRAILDPVIADAERLGDLRLEADVLLGSAMLRQFQRESPDTSAALRRELDRVSQIAEELGDPIIAVLPESIVGLYRVFTGDLREGIAMLEKTAPQLAQKHDFVGSSFALVALAMGYARLGEFDKAEAAATNARQLAEQGDIIAKLDSMIGAATVRSVRGDLEGAVPLAMQCTNMAEESGAVACVVASNYTLGDVFMRQGKFEDAQRVFERSHEVAQAIGERQFRPSLSAYMRSNFASLGEFGPNMTSFEDALEQTRLSGDHWAQANILWKRAETTAKRAALGMPVADAGAPAHAGRFCCSRTGIRADGRPALPGPRGTRLGRRVARTWSSR